MRFTTVTRVALLATLTLRQSTAFMVRPAAHLGTAFATTSNRCAPQTRLFFSQGAAITDITKQDLEDILEDYEQGGREDSGYLILDVRGDAEVSNTGKLSPSTQTLPLPEILEGCLLVSEEAFMEKYGFDKPAMDETLVFSCAAGIRARRAAEQALGAGYTKVVVYGGGANEWFA